MIFTCYISRKQESPICVMFQRSAGFFHLTAVKFGGLCCRMLQAKTVFSYFHFLYRNLLFLPATSCYKNNVLFSISPANWFRPLRHDYLFIFWRDAAQHILSHEQGFIIQNSKDDLKFIITIFLQEIVTSLNGFPPGFILWISVDP